MGHTKPQTDMESVTILGAAGRVLCTGPASKKCHVYMDILELFQGSLVTILNEDGAREEW